MVEERVVTPGTQEINGILVSLRGQLVSNNEEIMGIVAKRCEAAERKAESHTAQATPERSAFGGSSFAASVFGEAGSATTGSLPFGRPHEHARRSSLSPRRNTGLPGCPPGKSGTLSDDAPSMKKFATDGKSPATPFGFGGRTTFTSLFKGPDSEEDGTSTSAGATKLREEEQKLLQRQNHLRAEEERMGEHKSQMEKQIRDEQARLAAEKARYEAELQERANRMEAQATELQARAKQQQAKEATLRKRMAEAARIPVPSSPLLGPAKSPLTPGGHAGDVTPPARSRMPMTPPMELAARVPAGAEAASTTTTSAVPAAAKSTGPKPFPGELRPAATVKPATSDRESLSEKEMHQAKVNALTDLAKLFGKVDRRPMSPGQKGFVKYHEDYPLDGVVKAYMGR